MDLTNAVTEFEELKSKIVEHRTYLTSSETVTRVLLIDPVLQLLGWDVRNPDLVQLEFRTAEETTERADYILKNVGTPVAVVEAKKLDTSITSKEKRQVKEYADYAEVTWCALTDGSRWMIYDLDEGRNPETMTPKVELDIEKHASHELALNCLLLWQQNLSSPHGPILAETPIFDHVVETATDYVTSDTIKSSSNNLESDSSGQKDPTTPESKTSETEIDAQWSSVGKLGFSPTKKRAVEVRFGSQSFKPKDFTAAFVEIVSRMVMDGSLTPAMCPIKSTDNGEKFAVATTPFHENGNEFRAVKNLPKDLFLEASYSNKDKLDILRKLLTVAGVNPQTVSIRWVPQ